MKALVLKAPMHLSHEDYPDPVPKPDEVLVRVSACGICGSDVHGMDGSTGRRIPPVVMGHEASGTIVAVGRDVGAYVVGDRVTFDSTVYCGTCGFCRKGMINLCDNRRVLGVSCGEYRCDGAFAEYVAVPERILYRLPEGLPFTHAAMVEPLSVAFHAVERAGMPLNGTAVVFGAGIIGLFALQVLRTAGAGSVTVVDTDEDRLELARTLGADYTVNPLGDDPVAVVRDFTSGGADLAIEAVGVEATTTAAVTCLRKGGSVVLVGNITPRVAIPMQTVVARQITLFGSCASNGQYPACLDMIARGTVDVEPLISRVAPLSEGAEWFGRLYEREAGLMKVLLAPDE